MDKSKLKRVVIEVEPQIHKKLRMKALKLGESLGAIGRRLLVEEWLPEKKAAQQEEAKQ